MHRNAPQALHDQLADRFKAELSSSALDFSAISRLISGQTLQHFSGAIALRTAALEYTVRSHSMEWVLFVSLQWIVLGSATQPTSQVIQPFASEELCNKAAEALRNELNAPIPAQRVQTLGRVVCLRKDK